jgi:type VI secretion system Hcp family effector
MCKPSRIPAARLALAATLALAGAARAQRPAPAQLVVPAIPDPIEIFSVDWGVSIPPAGPGTTPLLLRDVVFVKPIDKSSPLLAQALCRNENLGQVKIELRKAEGDPKAQPYATATLDNVRVSSYSIRSTPPPEPSTPLEQFSFTYQEIRWTYQPQGPGLPGAPSSLGWDATMGTCTVD